jgi:hypothetical protein
MSELRPSFQERDRYLDLLSTAYADGRLDEAEFETRSNAVLAAVTHREAMAQFQGLPQPNIVPVQAPPSAFRPVPQAPQAFRPQPIARRGVMAGAVGVAAVVGLGLAGFVSMATVSDEVTGEFPDPVFVPVESLQQQFLNAGQALRDLGYDAVSELSVTHGQVTGMAWRVKSPGQGGAFDWYGDGTMQYSEVEGASPPSSLLLEEAELLVLQAEDAGLANLPGALAQVELVWQDGRPTARATAFEPDGWIQVDQSGEIIAREEP